MLKALRHLASYASRDVSPQQLPPLVARTVRAAAARVVSSILDLRRAAALGERGAGGAFCSPGGVSDEGRRPSYAAEAVGDDVDRAYRNRRGTRAVARTNQSTRALPVNWNDHAARHDGRALYLCRYVDH